MKLRARLRGARPCLLRFLLFPHSVGHLGLVAFLTPHWQPPVMRE